MGTRRSVFDWLVSMFHHPSFSLLATKVYASPTFYHKCSLFVSTGNTFFEAFFQSFDFQQFRQNTLFILPLRRGYRLPTQPSLRVFKAVERGLHGQFSPAYAVRMPEVGANWEKASTRPTQIQLSGKKCASSPPKEKSPAAHIVAAGDFPENLRALCSSVNLCGTCICHGGSPEKRRARSYFLSKSRKRTSIASICARS